MHTKFTLQLTNKNLFSNHFSKMPQNSISVFDINCELEQVTVIINIYDNI